MPSYENLVQIETEKKIVKKKKLTSEDRGCDNCTCRKGWKHGYKPIMGKVHGKELFIWAQNPGKQEVKRKEELVGPAGEIIWREFKKHGVKRRHCDIQNVVRCLPTEKDDYGYRQPRNTPNKEEIFNCSIYNERALEKSKAKVHLIFGIVAARQILGREYQKGQRNFFSEKLNARIIITDHPAFFLYSGTKGNRWVEFQNSIALAAKEAFGKKIKTPKGLEKFRILLEQKYIGVITKKQAKLAYRDIKRYAIKRKSTIACDFEWKGQIGLVYGFCPKPGLTYVFVLDHPKNLDNPDRKKVIKYTGMILTDKKIRKSFHHGCSDRPATKEIYNWKVRNFYYDTELGAYFHDSSIKAYGLTKLADRWFPEFSNYKEVVMPEALPEGIDYKKGRRYGNLDYSRVPIDKLILYNGADADLGKRIELKTKDSVSPELMHIYRDASFVLSAMEPRGPYLDYEYHKELEKIFPVKVDELKEKIRKICGEPELNPRSPKVTDIIYDKLKLQPITIFSKGKEVEVRNRRATTLELMNAENPHPFLAALIEYSEYNAINTKGLKSFKNSADLNKGRLRTTWWLTGTITFRLRSGGSREGEEQKKRGIINLQNVPKNKMVKNLIISDTKWHDLQAKWARKAFELFCNKTSKWKRIFEIDEKKKERTPRAIKIVEAFHKFTIFSEQAFLDLYTFMAFDFSQMEVRVLAQMSEDPKLIEFFVQGVDIHSAIGSVLTGWTVEKIKNDADTRAACKSIIFAIIYGKQHRGLYQQLINEGVKISFERVGELLEAFWKKFKRVKELMDSFKEQAEDKGYVGTLFGSRRPIGDDEARNTFTGNQAVNSPIQGTAHQISIIAMALLERRKKELHRLQDLRMEVHDQLVWRLKVKHLAESNRLANKLLVNDTIKVIKEEFGINWKVPLRADGEAGFRLGTMVKLGKEVNLKYWINEWCLINQGRIRDVQKELKKVNA
jgi:uracil-DNA glycosylase family 4